MRTKAASFAASVTCFTGFDQCWNLQGILDVVYIFPSPPSPLRIGKKKMKENKKERLKTQNKSILYKENKDMYTRETFPNSKTQLWRYANNRAVFASPVRSSSCIAVPLPGRHRWNTPATSWSQLGTESCQKHTSLLNSLPKVSCNWKQGGKQAKILNKITWMNLNPTWSWRSF